MLLDSDSLTKVKTVPRTQTVRVKETDFLQIISYMKNLYTAKLFL